MYISGINRCSNPGRFNFFLSESSRPALGLRHLHIQYVKIKNGWRCTTIPPHILVKYAGTASPKHLRK